MQYGSQGFQPVADMALPQTKFSSELLLDLVLNHIRMNNSFVLGPSKVLVGFLYFMRGFFRRLPSRV
jgi:hypothetical protein